MAKRTAPALADLKPIVEALLFASDEPLSARTLRVLIEGEKKPARKRRAAEAVPEPPADAAPADVAAATLATDEAAASEPTDGNGSDGAPAEEPAEESGGADARTIRACVDALNEEYGASGRPWQIVEIAGGYQFATRPEFGLYVGRLARDRSRRRLSQAGLETLAIIAYRQPISKPDIEAIRGVNCDEVLSSLLERNLATITGRAETVGRPLLYGTTDAFLHYFGLMSLKDLPRPREIDELMESAGVRGEQPTVEVSSTENVAQIEEHLAPTYEKHEPQAAPAPEPAQSAEES